jgi:hypothetical protein
LAEGILSQRTLRQQESARETLSRRVDLLLQVISLIARDESRAIGNQVAKKFKAGLLPCTVTLFVWLPTVSAKSGRARWSTSTTTPFWRTVLKPVASTVMV